jgi:hypothetical protein
VAPIPLARALFTGEPMELKHTRARRLPFCLFARRNNALYEVLTIR